MPRRSGSPARDGAERRGSPRRAPRSRARSSAAQATMRARRPLRVAAVATRACGRGRSCSRRAPMAAHGARRRACAERRPRRSPRVQRTLDDLADELVGHRVVVAVELDVVVDVDLGLPPGRELVAARWAAAAGPGGRAARTARLVEPSIFLNGPALITVDAARAIAALASAREVKRRCRSRAMIQRSASSTPASTLALSRGL